ncbi:MAG: LysR family transcriptional regulator [Lachnospiraceae bacterium]|nr:LysR family transcriptional regulator [Lachnospiraceae bacterium]
MTIQQLKLIKTLAECGSISRASQQCFLSQPALTRQIQAMEKELGFSLFERCYNGVKPTQPGRVFYEEIKPLLNQYEKALLLARQANSAALLSGIRIGSYYYLMSLVAPACHFGRSQNDAFDFDFISCRLCDTLEYLKNDKIDIGVYIDFAKGISSLFYSAPIALASNMCKVPQGHPLFGKNQVSLSDLDHQTVLLPRIQTENIRQIQKHIAQSGLDIQIQYFETPDQAEAIGLAKNKVIFILPPFVPNACYHHAVIADLPKPVLSILTRKEDQTKYAPVIEQLRTYFQSCLHRFPGLLPLTID